jgi:hypothetical protein
MGLFCLHGNRKFTRKSILGKIASALHCSNSEIQVSSRTYYSKSLISCKHPSNTMVAQFLECFMRSRKSKMLFIEVFGDNKQLLLIINFFDRIDGFLHQHSNLASTIYITCVFLFSSSWYGPEKLQCLMCMQGS